MLAETRPIYLYLTQEKFLEPQGEKYVGYPPLRDRADVEAIWEATRGRHHRCRRD